MVKEKTDNPLFSIVIPVYNVGQYLDTSIKSVLIQDFNNYEAILVDDGSTDGSPVICDWYGSRDSRITVIHKENGGLSDARNQGTKRACGDYIIYLDSDDFFSDKHFLSKAENLIKGACSKPDIIVFGYSKYYDRHNRTAVRLPVKETYLEGTVADICERSCFKVSAWGKILNSAMLKKNQIFFRERVLSEDMEWCAKLITAGNHAIAWNATPYAYRQRKGSISMNVSAKHLADLEYNMAQCILLENSCERRKLNAFRAYMAMNVSMYMIVLAGMDKKLWQPKTEKIKIWERFLSYGIRIRERMIDKSIKTVGIMGTLNLLRVCGMLVQKNKRKV